MTKKSIREFIDLLRNPITGHDYDYERECPNGNDSKPRFEKLGKAILREIAEKMQLPSGSYDVRWNPGGPAVSGDIILHTDRIYVHLSQTALGFDFGFMYRLCEGRKDYTGGKNRWAKWDELLDLDKLAEHFSNLCNLTEP